jgi:glucose-6-phosphate 1-epimerase
MDWDLIRRTDYGHETVLVFRLEDSPETRSVWNHVFCAEMRMILGEECSVDLEVEGDMEFTAALHSYFYVGDIEKVTVSGLGEKYRDALQGGKLMSEKYNGVSIDREVDRVYVRPDPVIRIWDDELDRIIEIVQRGHSDTVLWNPWVKKSAGMVDIPEGAYRNMICVETAAISKPLAAKPNAPARLGLSVICQKLESECE